MLTLIDIIGNRALRKKLNASARLIDVYKVIN